MNLVGKTETSAKAQRDARNTLLPYTARPLLCPSVPKALCSLHNEVSAYMCSRESPRVGSVSFVIATQQQQSDKGISTSGLNFLLIQDIITNA